MRKVLFLVIISFLLSCEYEPPEIVPFTLSSGSADFSNIIVIGNSFTAGYMDGALYSEGQANSIPAIIASQIYHSDTARFIQPDIYSENGYNQTAPPGDSINGRLVSKYISYRAISPEDVATKDALRPEIAPTVGEFPIPYAGDTINNFSVPGLKSFQVNDPGLLTNPYYARFASNPGVSTLLGDALATDPSFFVLCIGMSDIFNYAVNGGSGNSDPGNDPSQIQKNDLTPLSVFEDAFNEILNSLLLNTDANGIITNIPYLDYPLFIQYSYNFLRLTSSEIAKFWETFPGFTSAISIHNIIFPAAQRPYIDFNDMAVPPPHQAVVIEDMTLEDAFYPNGLPLPKLRQLTPGEYVLSTIPIDQVVTYGLGSSYPAPSEYILTKNETELIKQRIDDFNNIIEEAVYLNSDRIALIDINSIINTWSYTARYNEFTGVPLSKDIVYHNGVPVYFSISKDGAFSLDGINPNQRGNAYFANVFIDVINEFFGSNIPEVDVNNYRGNTFINDF